jgi:hypothetical protein
MTNLDMAIGSFKNRYLLTDEELLQYMLLLD